MEARAAISHAEPREINLGLPTPPPPIVDVPPPPSFHFCSQLHQFPPFPHEPNQHTTYITTFIGFDKSANKGAV